VLGSSVAGLGGVVDVPVEGSAIGDGLVCWDGEGDREGGVGG
jgi:hypothetical protein